MKWIYNKSYIESRATLFSALLMVITFAFIVSCNELDIAPTDSFTEAVVFDDPALAEAFVNYAYRTIPHGFAQHPRFLCMASVIDETNSRAGFATVGTIIAGNQSSTYLGTLDVWTSSRNRTYWPTIKQANEFLEKTEESTLNPVLLARLRAEARTLRAYSYFRLGAYFGGVPLITEPFDLDADWRVPRNSYDEIMSFVFSELDDVIDIDVLPLEYPDGQKGRVTKGAAMAIKARALLYYASPLNNPANDLSRWQAAADASKDIIDLGIYELYHDYQELFMEAGGYNSEVIWGRPFNNQIDREQRIEQLLFPNGVNGFAHPHPIQDLVDDFEMDTGLLPKDCPTYDPQNPYVNRDPRFYATIWYDGAPFKDREIESFFPGGMDSVEGPVSAWNATETGYYTKKYADESQSGAGWDGTSDPLWQRYRYGEVLLNYAEAMYQLGDEDTAREYVNKIRNRPGVEMPLITESGEDLWERIIHERRIELVFEEHRYFDVRRWKIAPDVLNRDRHYMYIWKDPDTGEKTYEVRFFQEANFTDRNYLAPIPQSEIDRNGLLEQNPGY